jgi:hypothetical protein
VCTLRSNSKGCHGTAQQAASRLCTAAARAATALDNRQRHGCVMLAWSGIVPVKLLLDRRLQGGKQGGGLYSRDHDSRSGQQACGARKRAGLLRRLTALPGLSLTSPQCPSPAAGCPSCSSREKQPSRQLSSGTGNKLQASRHRQMQALQSTRMRGGSQAIAVCSQLEQVGHRPSISPILRGGRAMAV